MNPVSLREFIAATERRFARSHLYFGHGTDNARDEAAWLAASVLGLPFGELARHLDRPLDEHDCARLEALVSARIRTRKPLAYLLNEAWFAGLRFHVDERVLVPRSLIGELIRSRFAPHLRDRPIDRILDLGTGSGCIAIAAACAYPLARIDATDLSADALAVARINVDAHGVAGRVALVESDLFDGLAGRRYDLILANPPYVSAAEMARLPAEYRQEPALALASGEDGLDALNAILAGAAAHLTHDGVLICEVGNRRDDLPRRFPGLGFRWLPTPSGDDCVFLLERPALASAPRPSSRRHRGRPPAAPAVRRRRS